MHSFAAGHITSDGAAGTRAQKLTAGSNFIKSISALPIRFAGVSGSVSYEPLPEDDIDIFIITEDRKLWTTVAGSLIKRRLLRAGDICLCLFMTESYAKVFFRKQKDPLISEDSVRTVAVIGEDFYRGMLAQSDYLKMTHPAFNGSAEYRETETSRTTPLEIIAFILLAAFLKMKGIMVNSRLSRTGREEEMFETRISRDFMILDSRKYRRLQKEMEQKNI